MNREVLIFSFPTGSFERPATGVKAIDIKKEFSIRGFEFFARTRDNVSVYKRGKEAATLKRVCKKKIRFNNPK